MEIAARNNPGVLQKYSEYQAALEKVPQVGSLPDPELTFGVFISPMELVEGRQLADIRLMQMFPWIGTLKAAKEEMSLMATAKYESFIDEKLQVFYDVQRTWYELLENREEIRITEENIGILQVIERIAIAGYKTNTAGGSDLAGLYRIQIETGDLENNDSMLNNQQRTLIAKFNGMLNRPSETPVFLADTLLPVIHDLSLTTLPDSIFNNNPMLVMLDYERQSLDARKEMVTKMGYPMIGLGVDYSVIQKSNMSTSSMNGKDMIMPMATVTLPIYRKKYKAMQSEADLQKTATEQGYTATVTSLRTDYYETFQTMQDAKRRIKLYTDQRDLAGKTVDILLKSFSVNSAGLTEILQARRQILDYSLRRSEAITEYNTAVAGLKRILAIAQLP
jgi:outer membrane protein TolC